MWTWCVSRSSSAPVSRSDRVVATAILDRLLHHSHVVTIRGDSYRLREKRREGLVTLSQSEAAP
jgi:DNA replication protein DnaC